MPNEWHGSFRSPTDARQPSVSSDGWFLTYGAGHPHSLARTGASGYRGLNEKIAPRVGEIPDGVSPVKRVRCADGLDGASTDVNRRVHEWRRQPRLHNRGTTNDGVRDLD